MTKDSIWFVASNGSGCRFDLCGNLLEVLKHLTSGNIGQNKPSGHNSPHLGRIVPDGLLKSDVCERYNEIAVYCGNSDDLASKQFFLMKGVL
jgi:hypothetical protein